MKKGNFESIVRGLNDAIAYAAGEPNGCVVHTPDGVREPSARGMLDRAMRRFPMVMARLADGVRE